MNIFSITRLRITVCTRHLPHINDDTILWKCCHNNFTLGLVAKLFVPATQYKPRLTAVAIVTSIFKCKAVRFRVRCDSVFSYSTAFFELSLLYLQPSKCIFEADCWSMDYRNAISMQPYHTRAFRTFFRQFAFKRTWLSFQSVIRVLISDNPFTINTQVTPYVMTISISVIMLPAFSAAFFLPRWKPSPRVSLLHSSWFWAKLPLRTDLYY